MIAKVGKQVVSAAPEGDGGATWTMDIPTAGKRYFNANKGASYALARLIIRCGKRHLVLVRVLEARLAADPAGTL